jgi:acylphosphatase
MNTCKRAVYSGHVQGVGFRYSTHGLAQQHRVSGFVRNLRGGDVEVIAQGEAEEVDRFLAAIDERMTGYISSKNVQQQAPGNYKDFTIRM